MAAKTATRAMVRTVHAPAPVIRVSAPRAAPKKKGHHRRKSEVGGTQSLLMMVLGGVALGMLDKQGTKIPTVPMLGRAGTIAVGLYFFGKHNATMRKGAMAAAAIAGYEFGLQGRVSGVEGEGLAAQV
jgi:hypothetical protein